MYGREEWGQGFLVARRLVEAGVRMVQVNLRGWDTHQNAFRDLKRKLLPSIDSLLRRLPGGPRTARPSGQLALIVMCGEMGRTPRISPITVGRRNVSGEIFTPGSPPGRRFPCFFGGRQHPGRPGDRPNRQTGRRAAQRRVLPETWRLPCFTCSASAHAEVSRCSGEAVTASIAAARSSRCWHGTLPRRALAEDPRGPRTTWASRLTCETIKVCTD